MVVVHYDDNMQTDSTFVNDYDHLHASALGTLLEPEWLEQQLPIGVTAIRAKNPSFSEAQLQAAIFSAGVQKTLQWLDCGEELVGQVLKKVSAAQN
jgi:hypothetical protein